jgi:anion transporter
MVKFMKTKQFFGLLSGLIVLIVVWNLSLEGLSAEGQKTLALTLMTVIFWATKVSQAGYVSMLYLVSLVVFNVAPAKDVFSIWTTPVVYLVVGAFLIGDAVKQSGLGTRIAYMYILKFVHSFRSIIISCFSLQVILGLIIPHPFPRAFLILSVMLVIAKSANLSRHDTAIIGLSVFASCVPTAMIFLTADSTINVVAVSLSGMELSWIGWFYHMGIPSIAASVLTCLLILLLFKPKDKLVLDKTIIQDKLDSLGKLSGAEKRTIVWVAIAVVLWATDSLHGIHLGWITVLVTVMMSLPYIGGILKADSWKAIPFDTLLFLSAAMAIGTVGSITGMNEWIASVVLPSQVPGNLFVFGLLLAVISIFLHMILGSVMSVMSITIPAFVGFVSGTSINPLVPALIVYSSIAFHYILPHQHMAMLVGLGDNSGQYTDSHVIRLGIPLTAVVFIVILLVEIPWWKLTGLL